MRNHILALTVAVPLLVTAAACERRVNAQAGLDAGSAAAPPADYPVGTYGTTPNDARPNSAAPPSNAVFPNKPPNHAPKGFRPDSAAPTGRVFGEGDATGVVPDSTYPNDNSASDSSDSDRVNPDGTTPAPSSITNQDGSVTTTNADGSVTNSWPDGMSTRATPPAQPAARATRPHVRR